METEIFDIRVESDFKVFTFSNYKRCDVRKQLYESLRLSKIEAACFWSAEMICSGLSQDLWETLLHVFTKNIHLGNHKLCIILNKRLEFFRAKMHQLRNMLDIRNDVMIRQLMAELVTLVAVSKKKIPFERIGLKNEAFNINDMKEHLLAPANKTFFELSDEDSVELKLPMNELVFCIAHDNTQQAFYWIEWILAYEAQYSKNKTVNVFKVKRRDQFCKNPKFQKDVVWLIWESLEKCYNDKNSLYLKEIFDAALSQYTFNYTTASGRKRVFALFFVCSILTEKIDVQEKLLDDTHFNIVDNVKKNIHNIYKQIKKFENFKSLEYLIPKKSNETQTLDKLRQIEEFKFIPRVQGL